MSAAQSPSSLDALLDGVLKRLTPLVKPFHDSKSGAFKTTTALDTALVWTFKWTRGLRRQRNTFNEILQHDFAKSLRHVIFAWTVEHPKLFSSDVDPALLRSHHLEKEKIETIVHATKQFMHVLMHEATSEAVLNPFQGKTAAGETRWRDPRAGWQGVLLGLLEGLCNHLETRNPASAPNSQNDLSAYRDYIGVELVQGLVNIVFPSPTGKPTAPGDPIKDYKGHPVLAPEVKFAALDVLVESLRRQVATASALRKLLPFETMGSVLHSGYDMHLSASMLDIAYRLLPGRRKPSAATQVMSKRFTALEALFPEEVYGRNEADDLRKLFDELDKGGDWREHSSEILHRISVQHIKRAQAFSVHDFRSDGAHLLPVERGKQGYNSESLTATDVISQKIFVPTTVWFGRDSLTVLIDEPPEMTQRRKLEEKGTPDIRPTSGGQLAAVDETRDARAVVHYSAIHKVYVRQLDSAKDDYRITILSDKSLQIDGRPHTLDEEATHYGLEIDPASAPSKEAQAYHKLELLVAAEKANLGLLMKVLQDRMQRYPRLGAELGNFPAIPPPPQGKGNNLVTPAPKAAAKPSADAQTSSTTAAKAGAGDTSKSSAAGPARADAPKEVPQAPLRTSQADGIRFIEPRPQSGVDDADGTGAEGANGKVAVVEEEEEGGATTRMTDDLERRRDKLEAMARESSPAKSATSTRRRSKETEQDAAAAPETGELLETYDYNNDDFGGGFEDEEAREAASSAEISSRKERHSEEEDELLSPSRLGRDGGHRHRSASPQLDNNPRKVDSAKSKTLKQPLPALGSDVDDDDKGGKAKKPRQAKSPAPAKPAPPRRSARLSPPPAKLQGEKGRSRPSRSGAQGAAGQDEEASESDPEEKSRSRRGAAQNKKKQVVQSTTKQKRSREDEEDEDEDKRETASSLSELSDMADDSASRRKKTKARARASKRRKVEDKQEADKGDETDYEEQYSLPTNQQRRSDRRKFGKTVAPLKGNGSTRKANQPGAKAAAKGKAGSRAENKPGSKGSSDRGSKAGKKGPTKPTSKVVAGAGDSASEMSTEDVEGRAPARSTRASRSKAKKVVAPVSADAAGSSEEEERSPKKNGDKRIADDIPPPGDLTASEQLRVQRAGIRSPAISPAKAKPVQTLDQLTGNAPVPMGEPAAFDQAMDITQDGAEEQQEVFEADFEFDFAVADVDEIEAVFGPTPAKTTSEAAPKTGAREKDVPVSPLPSESIETVPRVIPQTDASASAAKPSTAGGEIPSAVAEPSSVPIQAVPSKDRPSVAAALAPAEEDASASTSVPAGKPLRQVGAAEVAPAPVSAVAASSNAAPVEKQPQRPLPSEPLPKPGPARGPVGAPFDDSGVHFVANETDVTRSLKKGGMAADSRRSAADSMDLDADEHNNTEAGAKIDTPASATPAVIPSPASHSATGLAGPADAADQHRGEAVHASRAAPRQQDVRPLQSTPARHPAAKQRPPQSFMPWSAIPTRTAALRQGTSRPVKPPIPAEVRQKAQSSAAVASEQKKAHANRSAAKISQQKLASPGHPAPAGAGHRNPTTPARMSGSRPRNKSDKIVLEERPLDCYEEFFDLLVDMGRALVKKQQEKAADLQDRRKAGTQKVEKLVARSAQRDNVETREIARMVVQRAAALDHNGASPGLQACAQDVGDNCAVLGDEVRELLRKLAAEKVA
ncbi:hypothetical protein B0A53_04885 [Rhodotorula sp. CCFEE 5036]|nr:hypothetical protein B0A53_04885 [Rhodotorula sp. CCFEE 5036]